ncbi:hypothetical protein C8R44DRAFT_850993 [Mycena epipterygia]|nr:hypothetical protein C8R44DRAFT_850993 [Mycena epipterygia]
MGPIWNEQALRLSQMNDLLRKCFRPVPGARPSLDELRYDIANMNSLLKIKLPAQSSAFFTLPRAHGVPSAPSTVDIFFELKPSNYPSPVTSDATSMFVELNPRISRLRRRNDHLYACVPSAACLALHLPDAVRPQEAVAQPAQAAMPLLPADTASSLDEEELIERLKPSGSAARIVEIVWGHVSSRCYSVSPPLSI